MAQSPVGLRHLIERDAQPVLAPLVLNPLMAKMAERAGFPALYLGGGAFGYLNCFTEANLSVTQLAQAAVEIRTACALPLILDGACGWGDPMHVRHSVRAAEAAGFAAIEIEDQVFPKRAHHHVGIEHMIPLDEMVDKVREAVDGRRSADFLIIGRTNAALRHDDLDEAIRRGQAIAAAGADLLLVLARTAEQARVIGRALPQPKVYMKTGKGLSADEMQELAGLDYRLFIDPTSPLMAMHRALRDCYAAIGAGKPDPLVGADTAGEREILHDTIELEALLSIERRTVEKQ